MFQDQLVDWRKEFTKWWHATFKSNFPPKDSVFNFYIDKESKTLLPWSQMVGGFDLDPEVPLQVRRI